MRTTRGILATGLVAAVLVGPGAPAGTAAMHVDAATVWSGHAAAAIFGAGQPPQQSVPHLAMVHGAVFDAVNAIDGGYEGYLLGAGVATPGDSMEAAAATAAHRVLVHLLPTQAPALTATWEAYVAALPVGDATTRGIAVGEAAAAAMIAARTGDGRFGAFRFAVGSGVGVWEPVLPSFGNDPNAWLKDVQPFLVDDVSRFRSKGPLPVDGNRYAREFREVKELGSATSTQRTADQTAASLYWAENPPATWSRILRGVATAQGLDVVDASRLYAEAWMTATDALIAVWDDKAHWSFWRPITAIRRAETDGNPWTEPDPDWLPLVPTPPYPEHPSGHLGLSGAMGATLRDFLGTDHLAWSDTNTAGLTRGFTRISQAVQEIVDARVWSGLHFRTADEASVRIAEEIDRWRSQHHFRPVR